MIVITGATGRIGLALVDALKARKEKFACIVRDRDSAKKLHKGVKFRLASLESGAGLAGALKDADIIVHLAGSTNTRESAHSLALANVVSAQNLYHSLPKKISRIVHASSIAVYGKRLPHIPCDEHAHPKPDTPYARTKWAGERIAREAAIRFPVTILRPAIVYGPHFHEGFFTVLKSIEKGQLSIIGKGDNYVAFVHVDDLVEALLLSIRSKKLGLSVYNISNPPQDSLTQIQLYETAAKELGVAAPKSHIPFTAAKIAISARQSILSLFGRKTSLTPEMADQIAFNRVFDTWAAQTELGWSPKIRLKEGIRQTVLEYNEWKKSPLKE